ncbi:MAG TPA: DMT family transporter [Gaiellaceae bacterium]|nr:DMT family transporter [Gaiellaceae bacterium]
MSRRGWALFAAMCVIWGIPYLMIRVAVRELTPATLVFGRTVLAALILLPVAAGRRELGALRPYWRPLLAFAVVEIAVPWLLLAKAEQKLTSSLTGLLIAAVPLVGAAITAVTGDDDRLSPRRLGGLLLGTVGVAAIVGLDAKGTSVLAVGEIAIVAVCYAVGPIIVTRSLGNLPGLGVLAAALTVCAIGYAPVAAFQLPSAVPSGRVLASVAGLAVICTAVAFLIFFELIAEVGPVRATVITYVNPAVAALLGVTILSESFTAGMGIGFALVLAGSVLATHRREEPALAAEPVLP